jgi:hypothetical protein
VVKLQALKPPQIEAWHRRLRTAGSAGGKPPAAQTVKHAHAVPTPTVTGPEMVIIEAAEIELTFTRLYGHRLYPIVFLAFSTGARRGELLALL